MKTKKIVCYFCKKRRGTAKRILMERVEKRTRERYKKVFWKARGFKRLGNNLYLCRSCNNKRCKRCTILLDNKRICKCCKKSHGAFYKKHPEYCKVCWDKKRKKKLI